jgi:hypothetical protein
MISILVVLPGGSPRWEEILQVAAFNTHDRIEGGVAILFGWVGVKDRLKRGTFLWDRFQEFSEEYPCDGVKCRGSRHRWWVQVEEWYREAEGWPVS